jgi:hypothetical protein
MSLMRRGGAKIAAPAPARIRATSGETRADSAHSPRRAAGLRHPAPQFQALSALCSRELHS